MHLQDLQRDFIYQTVLVKYVHYIDIRTKYIDI